MSPEKFYCGNCGSALYFGQKFKEHTLVRSCHACEQLNPIYFHYCYRCGVKLGHAEDESADEE